MKEVSASDPIRDAALVRSPEKKAAHEARPSLGRKRPRRAPDLSQEGCQPARQPPASRPHAASKRISRAPPHSTVRPSSARFSAPETIVKKWFPASCPILLAKCTPP